MIAGTQEVRQMHAARRHRTDVALVVGKTKAAEPCTRTSKRCVVATSYLTDLPPCCRGHLRQMMADVQQLFEELGVRWWADYGTLLGSVRNPLTTWADYPWLLQDNRPDGRLAPGIIPHDKDADLGALRADWLKIKRAAMLLQRKQYHVTVRAGVSLKIRFSRTNHTNLDVFLWEQRPDGILSRTFDAVSHYIPVDAYKGRDFPASWLAPMTTVPWENLTLPAPTDPEGFCAFRYGEDWRIPLPANHGPVKR